MTASGSIQVAANGIISSLLYLNYIYVIITVCVCVCVCVSVSFELEVLVLLSVFLGMGLVDDMVTVFFFF